MAKNWTDEEEEHIRENFLTQTYGELAEHFGVTTKAMESKIRRMGLKKQEILAETVEPVEPEPVVHYEEPVVPEEPGPAPIESIHKLQRRIEVFEESDEERKERLQQTQEAAETEKARREERRAQEPIAKALKKLEAGIKKLLDGKPKQAAKDFETVLDDPPNDLGLVMRARQYLAACEAETKEPKLSSAEDFYNHAVVLLNDGDVEGALDALEKAAAKDPKDDRVMYVTAIAQGLADDEEAALSSLEASIEANDANRVYARNDPDFEPLHDNDRFLKLTAPVLDDDDKAEEAESD